MLHLQVLGSGNAFSQGGRNTSCHIIKYNKKMIMLDAGPTVLLATEKSGVNLGDLDFLLVSHLHGDHIAGIPFLLLHFKFISKKSNPLKIIGPKGLKSRLKMLIEATYPSIFENIDEMVVIEEIEIGNEINLTENITVNPFESVHIENSFFYLLQLDKIYLSYSGDNKFIQDKHMEIFDTSHIIIHECSFIETSEGNHTSWELLKSKINKNLENKILILVHLGIDVQNAPGDLFPTNVIRAHDGSEFIFDASGKLKQMVL